MLNQSMIVFEVFEIHNSYIFLTVFEIMFHDYLCFYSLFKFLTSIKVIMMVEYMKRP